MTDNDEYYRRQAAEAQAQSERSVSDADKMSWLRIAQSWMQLIQRSVPSEATVQRDRQKAQEAFDAATEVQDTHQKRSDESH